MLSAPRISEQLSALPVPIDRETSPSQRQQPYANKRRKLVKANSCVCAMFTECAQGLLVASCSNHATRTEKLGYLGDQLARHARGAAGRRRVYARRGWRANSSLLEFSARLSPT